MRMNWMFLSTPESFHIKGPDGEPGGGETQAFDCNFLSL